MPTTSHQHSRRTTDKNTQGVAGIKARIHQGDLIFGVGASLAFNRSQLEDVLSQGSYDFVYVDSQHSAFSEKELAAFCRIAQALEIPLQFRIPHTRHTYLIGRYLDLGPSGIMVPEVQRTAEVDEAIAYFYYPQVGRRSSGGVARCNLHAFGEPTVPASIDRLAYADWWNSSGFLAIQLESIEAIINAHRLAKPGIDLLAFGPNDLRFSMEGLPQSPFKTVEECVRHVIEQMKDSSIQLSMGAGSAEERDKYIEMGVTVIQVPPGL